MFLPLLVATVLSADPVAPPPSPPPLVPTEAAAPVVAAPPSEPFVQQKPRPPRSAKRPLTVAGVASFGAAYGISLGIAAIAELGARSLPVVPAQTSAFTGLFVPVVGPIIAAADRRNSSNGTFLMMMAIDALVQAGGLTMMIIGLALPEPVAQPSRPTVWFTPTLGTNGAGAAFGGTF